MVKNGFKSILFIGNLPLCQSNFHNVINPALISFYSFSTHRRT